MLSHNYSNPTLQEQLQAELSAILVSESENRSPERFLDIGKLATESSLLETAFKDVLQAHASSLSTRIVLEDTSIGIDILLKRGGIVHMLSTGLHLGKERFGPNVESFDPAPFPRNTLSNSRTAFHPFGGGSTLCPGMSLRYAADSEYHMVHPSFL